MARYSLNLPTQLKLEAEKWAKQQGVSLNQFILWAVSEKVGSLGNRLDDDRFPLITYRTGASGQPTAVIRGTNIRVQTIVVLHNQWDDSVDTIADNYDLSKAQVEAALAFYTEHQQEIDMSIAVEEALEDEHAFVPA